jgi:hypothetical protein
MRVRFRMWQTQAPLLRHNEQYNVAAFARAQNRTTVYAIIRLRNHRREWVEQIAPFIYFEVLEATQQDITILRRVQRAGFQPIRLDLPVRPERTLEERWDDFFESTRRPPRPGEPMPPTRNNREVFIMDERPRWFDPVSGPVTPPTSDIDRTYLREAIREAEIKFRRHNNYTTESWENMRVHLRNARIIHDNRRSPQFQIDEMADNLITALNQLTQRPDPIITHQQTERGRHTNVH